MHEQHIPDTQQERTQVSVQPGRREEEHDRHEPGRQQEELVREVQRPGTNRGSESGSVRRAVRVVAPHRDRSRKMNVSIAAAWIGGLCTVAAALAPGMGSAATYEIHRVIAGRNDQPQAVTIVGTPVREDGSYGFQARVKPNSDSPRLPRVWRDHDTVLAVCNVRGNEIHGNRHPYGTSSDWIMVDGEGGFFPVAYTVLVTDMERLAQLRTCTDEELETVRPHR